MKRENLSKAIEINRLIEELEDKIRIVNELDFLRIYTDSPSEVEIDFDEPFGLCEKIKALILGTWDNSKKLLEEQLEDLD